MCGSVPVVCPIWYKQNPKIRGFRYIFALYVVRIWVFPFDSNAIRRFGSPRQKSHASVNGPNLVILAWTDDELSPGQAQNGVNFDFEVKFDFEGQGQCSPKTKGILTF